MNFLDIRTIMFSQLITDAVCTAVLIFLWLENRKRYAGMFFWVLDRQMGYDRIGKAPWIIDGSYADQDIWLQPL